MTNALSRVIFRDVCVDDCGKSGTTSLSVREKLWTRCTEEILLRWWFVSNAGFVQIELHFESAGPAREIFFFFFCEPSRVQRNERAKALLVLHSHRSHNARPCIKVKQYENEWIIADLNKWLSFALYCSHQANSTNEIFYSLGTHSQHVLHKIFIIMLLYNHVALVRFYVICV